MSKRPWSAYDKWGISVVIVTQICHSGQPSHGGVRSIFEVMISPLPTGTLVSVASVLTVSSITEILIGATRSRISYHLRDIYSICLSLNNSVDSIYPIENEIKDTTERDRFGSYLDLHIEIDNEGRFSTKLYDKRDDINFPIVNFPLMRSTIPAAHAYGVYISQMIRYSRACGSYQ
jgi:hypothetical protein